MPFNLNISETDKIVYVTAYDEINLVECVSIVSELAQNPNYRSDFDIVVSLQHTKLTVNVFEAYKIGGFAARFRDSFQGKTAMICQKQDLFLVNIYCVICRTAGIKIESFTNSELAMAYVTGEVEANPSG